MPSGDIKLYLTWKLLSLRRQQAGFFDRASYIPLSAEGDRKENVCAFCWTDDRKTFLVAAPRLLYRLTQANSLAPFGSPAWGDTRLLLPDRSRGRENVFRNTLTGQVLDRSGVLSVAQIMAEFPVGVLESHPWGD